MESRARASGEQFSTLLEFMESHGDLTKPQPGAQGRMRADGLWEDLANTLNSIGGGVIKTPVKWKKVWADWKSKTKKKGLTMRRHASGTVGGPSSCLTLTALETRVLGFIGALAVEGHSEIEEQGFNIPSIPLHLPLDLEIGVEDGIAPLPLTSPVPSPVPVAPYLPSTSRQLPTPTPERRSAPQPATLPTFTTPPRSTRQRQPPTPLSPLSSATSPHRRRLGARRRRALTPFDRAVSEFVAVEHRRLQLEEKRERNEARRIEVDNDRNMLLNRFADVAEAMLQQHLQSRNQ